METTAWCKETLRGSGEKKLKNDKKGQSEKVFAQVLGIYLEGPDVAYAITFWLVTCLSSILPDSSNVIWQSN